MSFVRLAPLARTVSSFVVGAGGPLVGLAVTVFAAGCSGAPDPTINDNVGNVQGSSSTISTTGSSSSDDDAGASSHANGNGKGQTGNGDDAGDDDGGSSNGTFGQTAVARGQEWIAAKMPYCGGPNGGSDVICGGTCERDGDADQPQWNKYRSDCSGFVSWSWGLAAPGHTTGDFAPYDTSVTHEIAGTDLQPGDALNNDTHVMLFGGWVDQSKGSATILEESGCGKVALTKTVTLDVSSASKTPIEDGTGRVFYAIRYNGS